MSEAVPEALKLIQEKNVELCSNEPIPPHSIGKDFVNELVANFSSNSLNSRILSIILK